MLVRTRKTAARRTARRYTRTEKMTLVMTEVSTYGVAMAADSAVTFPDGRVYVGAQKLLPVPQINAGLSIWGRGSVNKSAADTWLQNFIQNDVTNEMTLLNMAETLANRLNNEFGGPISDRMGIHVGGFDGKITGSNLDQ